MIRSCIPTDTDALVALADATGIFRPDEAESLLRGTLDALHAGRLGDGHQAFVATDLTERPTGWVYFGPHDKAEGVWELWWIGVAPDRHGQGIGGELLCFVESRVTDAGARLLLIETSALPLLDATRRFYANRSYTECGTVPDYYAEGEGKVTFAKRMPRRTVKVSAPPT